MAASADVSTAKAADNAAEQTRSKSVHPEVGILPSYHERIRWMVLPTCRLEKSNGHKLDDTERDHTGYPTGIHRVHRTIFNGDDLMKAGEYHG